MRIKSKIINLFFKKNNYSKKINFLKEYYQNQLCRHLFIKIILQILINLLQNKLNSKIHLQIRILKKISRINKTKEIKNN